MAARNYSNIAVETTLSSGINSSVTSLSVVSATGWPASPFILVIDEGEAEEELILVGGKSGNTFSSLTRGFGGTSGQAHSGGATIKHVAAAEDLSFIWSHVHDGNDDSATVDHGDLDGLGDDDHTQYHNDARAVTWHDADDHSGLSASDLPGHDHTSSSEGGMLSAEDLPGHDHTSSSEGGMLSAFDLPNHASLHEPGGADEVFIPFVEHADVFISQDDTLTGSYTTSLSRTLTIPATWGSWVIMVWAKFDATELSAGGIQAKITIDGDDGAEHPCSGSVEGFSIFERGTGVATGSVVVTLEARESSGSYRLNERHLMVQALRTS